MRGVFLDLASVDNGDLDRSSLAACLPRWDWHAFTPAVEVPARIAGAAVVVSNKSPLDRQALAAAGLKLVAVAATGTNNIDLRRRGTWASPSAISATTALSRSPSTPSPCC